MWWCVLWPVTKCHPKANYVDCRYDCSCGMQGSTLSFGLDWIGFVWPVTNFPYRDRKCPHLITGVPHDDHRDRSQNVSVLKKGFRDRRDHLAVTGHKMCACQNCGILSMCNCDHWDIRDRSQNGRVLWQLWAVTKYRPKTNCVEFLPYMVTVVTVIMGQFSNQMRTLSVTVREVCDRSRWSRRSRKPFLAHKTLCDRSRWSQSSWDTSVIRMSQWSQLHIHNATVLTCTHFVTSHRWSRKPFSAHRHFVTGHGGHSHHGALQ